MRTLKSVDPERVRSLNEKTPKEDGRYILYWIQSAQRAEDNPALEFAAQRANELDVPLLAVFICTPDYPEANLRHYTFMLEGLFETMAAMQKRGIVSRIEIGDPPTEILKWCSEAKEVVVDMGYLRHLKEWYRKVADAAACRVWQVETESVVPVELASEKAEYAARTIRPRIHRHLQEFLVNLEPTEVERPGESLGIEAFLPTTTVEEFLKPFKIDRSVKPVSKYYQGGQRRAKELFDEFLAEWLAEYDVQRNQPQTDYTSIMSPYLHFGQMSPVYLSVTMLGRCNPNDENVKSYLEELIVRRGLSLNFAHFEPHYDTFKCVPDWASKTLAQHAPDPRPVLLNRDQVEAAESPDPYWNAAQVEMVETGYMHNYMRMYWGKKILEWSASPEEAYETTLYLNNKYFLDGRDPASYANVAWIYGVHDRAWQEREIYGKIRCMMASGLERKSDPKAYVEKIEDLTGREVFGKSW